MNAARKQRKIGNSDEMNESDLLPDLPDHLAQLCLSTVPPSLLYSVCRRWRRLIYSSSFPPFFTLYALAVKKKEKDRSNSIGFFSLDPISSTWSPLPSPPQHPPLRLLHRHPSFISRNLSVQSLTVSNRLVVIAATNHHFLPALSAPLVFDPLSNTWSSGPPLSNPRRWCVTGSANGAIYIGSGIGSHYRSEVAKSVEKWDMKKRRNEWKWEKMEGFKDGSFSREAVDAVEYEGKLYMVNVKGKVMKEGAVYDIGNNRWEKMAEGMLWGWNGPAGVAKEEGEEVMYVVEEARGALRRYDSENDCWEEIIEESEHLKGAEQIAVGRGRVCVVCAKGGGIVVVDVRVRPVGIRVVNPPPEMEVIGVHILPRMSHPEN